MGRIPTVTSQVSANSGRTSALIPTPQASPDAFGAAGGRALQMLGSGVQDAAQGYAAFQDRKRDEDVANRVALSDFTSEELALRNNVGPDAAGYQTEVLSKYDDFVETEANKIEDDKARKAYKERMYAQRPNVSSRSAQYEFGAAATNATNTTNDALASLDNRIRLQPEQFDTFLQQGEDVVNSTTSVPATARAEAATAWKRQATQAYFEGRLDSAKDAHDVDAILSDLAAPEWGDRLSPQALDGLSRNAKAARSAITTKADADARAAVEFLEGRATDITYMIPPEELRATQQVVAASANPVTQARMARISRNQDILRETRKLPPDQQRAQIAAQKPGQGALPTVVNDAIMDASKTYGVSPSYLAGMVGREYGGYLKGDPAAIDYGKGNAEGASGAVGVGQIIPSTFVALSRDPALQAAVKAKTGIDMSTLSRDDLLELRKNPAINILASAAYAAENAALLRGTLGRDPSDAEMYMAHFLGGGGAVQLMRGLRIAPQSSAADMFPAAAKANPTIYYKKDGSARSLQELYDQLGGTFGGGSSYIEYGDAQTRNDILDKTEQGVKDDAMRFAFDMGNTTLSDVTAPDGMAQRGREARSVADYYNIPYEDMKPFTKDEAASIGKTLKEGTADDVVGILAQVQSMGGAMAAAAMKQVSDMDAVYGFAGALAADGSSAAASDVVRGQKRMEENPEIKKQIGANETEIADAFLTATGPALFDVSPKERQQVQQAAIAHYVETKVARGGAGTFDTEAFTASVNAVMGAQNGQAAIDTVNGEQTVLPKGLTGADMEEAFSVMTVSDWAAMSENRQPPRYADGTVADPRDLQDEAKLRPIGGGKYRVALDDGTYLVTGNSAGNGRLEAFIMIPDAKRVLDIVQTGQQTVAAAREAQTAKLQAPAAPSPDQQSADVLAAQSDGNLTSDEMAALVAKYGANWAYDAQGNRIIP